MAASATVPFVSVEEYLHTSPSPDVDYIDGVLEERLLGELDHSTLQRDLLFLFHQNRNAWKVVVYPELRVQVTPTRFRVPDVCVMPETWKRTQIVSDAPLLCLEVKSPEFTLSRERQRADDYISMGVREVWIFDPEARKTYVLSGENFTEFTSDTLRLEGTQIEVELRALFSALDL